VLIVEDTLDWQQLLTMIIKRLGHEVIGVGTEKEGVEQAFAMRPDLILMDLGLPEMSGDEATIRIKAEPAARDLPVVIQTAFGTSPAARNALWMQAPQDLCTSPISIADIQTVVQKYLSVETETVGADNRRGRSPSGDSVQAVSHHRREPGLL
jgi:CheY-like chemotaxis protein